MREGNGVEVADGWCEMIFRCPYCGGKGFSVKAKMFAPADGKIRCGACGEASRVKDGFFFGGFAFLAFFGGALGTLWLTFVIDPYFSLAVFASLLLGLFALGRILAPLRRLDAPYRAGFKLGGFLVSVFKRAK